ncbi:DUF7033 domain-containing protein [Maribacter vaceletii]
MFTKVLGIKIILTTTVEDFIKHTGPKITYTKQPLQNEFFVRSNDLLFEQGINAIDISINDWDGVPAFFATGERSSIPFDIFSASFYLLSRYEEYLPHVKDMHGRFPPKESIAYQNNFLQIPLVDLWALKLLDALKEKFPDVAAVKRKYNFTSIIDVTSSHCYAYRGIVRGISGFLLDLVYFRLKRIAQRVAVLFNPSKDPYNNYQYLINLHKKYRIKSMFFFQFASYSTYDKNVSTNNNKFKFLIKSVADYSLVSLATSYSSFGNVALIKKEKKELSSVINRPINYSRIRYNRVDIPETYRNLVEAEFTDDYTMGYTSEIGFRAGTCTPFYFYDIPLEIQQPIKIHPFAIHDYALTKEKSVKDILSKVTVIKSRVNEVNGSFNAIFSNELLGGDSKINWLKIYTEIIKSSNV